MVAPDAPTLTKSANGGKFNLTAGESLTLTLDENPTTGFRWQVEPGPGLELISSDYTPNAADAVGGGGSRTLKLLARQAGSHRVRAQLLRAWAGAGSEIDRCEFMIEVLPPRDDQESGNGIG